MKVIIINGPNLNLLGRREPEIYGTRSMDDILADLRSRYADVTIEYFQSNHEGDLIDTVQRVGFDTCYDGIVINAGGYSHTSVALADAIAAVPVPAIEVHMSNVFAREPFRRQSMLSPVCRGTITGLGEAVYSLAIAALIPHTAPRLSLPILDL